MLYDEISDDDTEALADALRWHAGIGSLTLGMSIGCCVRSLVFALEYRNMHERGAKAIIDALASNTVVTMLI